MKKRKIESTGAPGAIGPYSQGVAASDLLFLSGQIPMDPVTSEVVAGGIEEQTRRVLNNLKAVLESAGTDLGAVVKTTVFMTDLGEFAEMNGVYGEFFTEPYPARSTVEAAALPKGVKVEIDVVAVAPSGK